MTSPPMIVIAGLASALLASALVWGARAYALRRGLIDYPNARSSHDRPTPRGGGMAIVVPVLLFLGVTAGVQLGRWLMVAAILPVALVGWLDDHRPLPFAPRLAVHLGSGAVIAWMAHVSGALPLSDVGPLLASAWWIFWTVSAINVTNFMDGIDGIVGLQFLVFSAFAAIVLRGDPWGSMAAVVMFGAGAAFTVSNWTPARIFLGDAGSGSIGVLFVGLGILTIRVRGWTAVHAFLPLLPLFADELLTILRRIRQGEQLTRPHRTHVYQRLVQIHWPHDRVAVVYAAGSVGCAAWALLEPAWSLRFVAGCSMLLVATTLLMWRARARAERTLSALLADGNVSLASDIHDGHSL